MATFQNAALYGGTFPLPALPVNSLVCLCRHSWIHLPLVVRFIQLNSEYTYAEQALSAYPCVSDRPVGGTTVGFFLLFILRVHISIYAFNLK